MSASTRNHAMKATAERLADSARGARAQAQPEGTASRVRLAVIAAVGANSDYTVSIIAANGSPVDQIPGVRVWGAGTYAINDRVTVAYIGDRPVPWILAGGGSGGGSGAGRTVIVVPDAFED